MSKKLNKKEEEIGKTVQYIGEYLKGDEKSKPKVGMRSRSKL